MYIYYRFHQIFPKKIRICPLSYCIPRLIPRRFGGGVEHWSICQQLSQLPWESIGSAGFAVKFCLGIPIISGNIGVIFR